MNPEQEIERLKRKLKLLEGDSKGHGYDSDYLKDKNDTNEGDEIGLMELWNIVWQGKLLIIAITAICMAGSVFYALSLPNVYKSEALLMPNSEQSGDSSLRSLAGQFGGLASLAGVSLSKGGIDKTTHALHVLKSREFLYKFIENNDLKAPIIAAEDWSREQNALLYDEDIYIKEKNVWVRDVSPPLLPEPSLREAYEAFLDQNLNISQNKETGMITLSISHYSPYLAKQLVDDLTSAINKAIKKQDMAEAQSSINYLNAELKNTNNAGAQNMFYQLIEQQQQTLMLTKVREDYVLKTVDRAVVSEVKEKPSRAIICVLGTVLGGFLGIVYILLKKLLSKRNKGFVPL